MLNKLDLVDSHPNNQTSIESQVDLRQVSIGDIQKWSKDRRSYGDDPISLFEVSAKNGTNVNIMFESIIKLALSTNIQINPSTAVKSSAEYSADKKIKIIEKSLISLEESNDDKEVDYSYQKNSGDDEEQAIAKIVIAGAEAVGKTFILTRFVGDDKDHNEKKYEPTVGADLRILDMAVKDRFLTLQIWDTSGNPKMLSIGRSIYKDADCLILVYDITSKSSFLALEMYWENYLAYAQPFEPDEFPVILVGNKVFIF